MVKRTWLGFVRGLLLGLLGGVAAGGVEATSIIRDAPATRAALLEAGLYATVVDGLAGAAIVALAGAVFAACVPTRALRRAPRAVPALYVSGAVTIIVALAGLLWEFRTRASAGEPFSLRVASSILAVAIVVGASTFPLARPFASPWLAQTKRVAVAGIVGAVSLALVFPIQVVLEARQSFEGDREPAAGVAGTLGSDVRPPYLSDELEQSLERIAARQSSPVADRPNILLITVDALRADHLGACGNDWIETPTIDLLARYAVLSCSTYPQQPQTNPSLASVFTSAYPWIHGVRMHMVDRLSDSFDTLAKAMQRGGYATAGIIPWTSLEPAFSGFQQGFRTYEAFVVNEPQALKNPATAALAGVYRRVTNQVALGSAVESVLGMRQGTEAEIDGRADVTAEAAMNWLAGNREAPFFLWVHYFDPHYPFTPPEPWDQLYEGGRDYDGKYDGGMGFIYEMRAGSFAPSPRDVEYLRAQYASEVSYTDHYIGQMLGYLARAGLLENTIIVLTADHGEALGERGAPSDWLDGTFWLHGDDLHSEGMKLPFLVYDPRSTGAPQRLDVPLESIDVMPTILDLVGLPTPVQAQGRSVVPLLSGGEDGLDRVAVTTLGDDSQTSIVTADGWKLIVSRAGGIRELYYLPDDPEERTNRVQQNRGQALLLARQLEARTRVMRQARGSP